MVVRNVKQSPATLDSDGEASAATAIEPAAPQRGRAGNLDHQRLKALELLVPAEAAVYVRSSTSTLAKYRCYGGGPNFIKQSARKILYRRADLDAWLERNTNYRDAQR